MLEHIASIIGPWLDIIEHNLPRLSCCLSMTDSTTSAGWMRRSNFAEKNDSEAQVRLKRIISREHAWRYFTFDVREYSQWFPGRLNDVVDSLSRDFHLDTHTLTIFIQKFFSEQIPPGFEIRPLPQEIISWLYVSLLSLPEGTQPRERRSRSTTAHGADGKAFLRTLKSMMTHSSEASSKPPGHASSLSLPSPCDKELIASRLAGTWRQTLSALPWKVWHRPFGNSSTMTQDSTPLANLAAFYRDSTAATKLLTRQANNKRQSQ